MKKLLFAVPIVAVAAGAASPLLIGSKVESVTKQYVEVSNNQLEKALAANAQISGAKVELDSYEKSYLDSQASGKVTFNINMGREGTEKITVPFTSDIKHGPYLGEDGFGASTVITRPDLSGFDLPDAIDENTLIIKTVVGFSGDVKAKATVAPIAFEQDGMKFDFAGAVANSVSPDINNRATGTGDIAFDQLKITSDNADDSFLLKPFTLKIDSKGEPDLSKGTYTASSSPIEAVIGETKGSIVLQKIDMAGSYADAKGSELLSVGNVDASFDDLVITSENLPAPIKLPKLSFTSLIEQKDGTDFDILGKYAFDLDPSLMQVLNSPVDVNSAELSITLKSLSVEALEELYTLNKTVLNSDADNHEVSQLVQTKLLGIFEQLVKSASAANIEVHAKSAEGDLDADIDVGFKPGLDLSEAELMGVFGSQDPSNLLAVLVGRGDVSLAKGITDKAGVTPMIQIMAADFVTLEGETFKSNVKIDDGKLLVNGQPLPMM